MYFRDMTGPAGYVSFFRNKTFATRRPYDRFATLDIIFVSSKETNGQTNADQVSCCLRRQAIAVLG
jgi:hypothetical protein